MALTPVDAIRLLELENEQLRRAVGRLAHRLEGERYHPRRIERARDDALLLAMWKGAGIHPSRRFAVGQGMTETQWSNAIALLRLARVVTGNRRWVTTDTAVVEQRLERAAKAAIESETAYLARHVRYRRR